MRTNRIGKVGTTATAAYRHPIRISWDVKRKKKTKRNILNIVLRWVRYDIVNII